MSTFLTYLVVIATIVTAVIMGTGIINMLRKQKDGERSNRLMRYRIFMQGVVLLLFAALYYFGRS